MAQASLSTGSRSLLLLDDGTGQGESAKRLRRCPGVQARAWIGIVLVQSVLSILLVYKPFISNDSDKYNKTQYRLVKYAG